jgi:DNA (cytosine-5)-methyltransferase 1
VSELEPDWFVMENVEGILNIGEGVVLRQILEDFSLLGYNLTVRVVNMADYGVPQRRRRAIFVGNRLNKEFQWPQPSRSKTGKSTLFDILPPHLTVNDALGDLHLPQGRYFAHRANSQMRGPRNRVVEMEPAFTLRVRGDEFALCEFPAESSFIPGPKPDEPRFVRPPENDFQEFMQSWNSKSRANLSMERTHAKAERLKGTRRLTLREQARLQTFPDSFEFQGSVVSQARQIRNAVPPLFAAVLFEAIASQS